MKERLAEYLGWLVLALAMVLVLAGLLGCPGAGVRGSCTRHPDGRIECSVELHRKTGTHDPEASGEGRP
jgi:hypothetical protein